MWSTSILPVQLTMGDELQAERWRDKEYHSAILNKRKQMIKIKRIKAWTGERTKGGGRERHGGGRVKKEEEKEEATSYQLRSRRQATVLHKKESLSNIKHSKCALLLLFLVPSEVLYLLGDCVHAHHINKAAMLTVKVHLLPFLSPATCWEDQLCHVDAGKAIWGYIWGWCTRHCQHDIALAAWYCYYNHACIHYLHEGFGTTSMIVDISLLCQSICSVWLVRLK